MKKIMKIGALSLALIASLLLLNSNRTNAQVAGDVSLDITTGVSSCVYGTSMYIGSQAASFAASDMTGAEFPETFECIDLEGLSDWTMTMQASSDLTNGTVAQDIPAANVSMIAHANYLSTGACTPGANQTTWASIGAAPATILNKSGNVLDVCGIAATGVNLAVHIPASQAVGTYTGDLTLTMPF